MPPCIFSMNKKKLNNLSVRAQKDNCLANNQNWFILLYVKKDHVLEQSSRPFSKLEKRLHFRKIIFYSLLYSKLRFLWFYFAHPFLILLDFLVVKYIIRYFWPPTRTPSWLKNKLDFCFGLYVSANRSC